MTRIAPIPLRISEVLLPEDSLNVIDLSTFPVPSDRSAPKLLALTDDMLFSETASLIQDEQRVAFLQSLAMPTAAEILEIRERRDVAWAANPAIQSLVYPHTNSDIRLPLWIIEYWMEAQYILEAKNQWHAAIAWLQQKKTQGTLGFLVDEKAKAGGNKVAVSKPKPAPAPGNGHSRQVDDNDFSMLFD